MRPRSEMTNAVKGKSLMLLMMVMTMMMVMDRPELNAWRGGDYLDIRWRS